MGIWTRYGCSVYWHEVKRPQLANPPNRFFAQSVEYDGLPPTQGLELYEDASKTILSKNSSPDLGFRFSVNPYRGCSHACAYCYARPTHEYLGFGAGTDFDRKLLVKRGAPALLREALASHRWTQELILFSGNTDCYQPLEASLKLTRGCLEACLEARTPVAIITKSALVERDIDLFQEFTRVGVDVSVRMSIPFWDADAARLIEPQVPTPQRRVGAIERLAASGVPVGVNVAPVIPGLTDQDIPDILNAAGEAGADSASMIMLRLPGSAGAVFARALQEHLPQRAAKILSAVRSVRSGNESDSRFGSRMSGEGTYAEAIHQLFRISARRAGLDIFAPEPSEPGAPSPVSKARARSSQLELVW
jgi:DNA repair photolyase